MATKRWILFLLPVALCLLLAGCGGSTANVQNPPPPPPGNITIAFQPQPAASINVSFSENVTAVVTNDPSNCAVDAPNPCGVDWVLTCPGQPPNSAVCGSLSASHTANGAPTTYTAPSTISTNSMVVEIVAYATASHLQNVVAPITVSTFASLLKGAYVLQVQGTDANGGPNYQLTAVINLDGNGNVINQDGTRTDPAGEQTVNFFDTNVNGGTLVSKSDTIISTGSSYFLGSDGRGTITLSTGDNDIGGNGIETFTFVVLTCAANTNPCIYSGALISQMDLVTTATAATGASATGTMDLQPSSPLAPSGGYAFAVSGFDVVKSLPVAIGGVFNIDSANAISGNGSVADEILEKKVNPGTSGSPAKLSGTLTPSFGATTVPDQFGAFILNLTAGFGTKSTSLQFTGYIVDSNYIKLIESDIVPGVGGGAGTGFAATAGLAIGQGSATGTFTESTALGTASGTTYVFGVLGTDLSTNNSSYVPDTLTAATVLTAVGAPGNPSGTLNNGYTDTFLALNLEQDTTNGLTGAQISASFSGTYSVDSSGTGRATLTPLPTSFSPDPKGGYDPEYLFYLSGDTTGNGNPAALVLHVANGDTGDKHYPSLGAGIAYPQVSPAFSGDYGISFAQELSGSSENDGTAQLNVTPPSLSGIADVNLAFGATPDQPFLGSFATPAANGVFPGTLVDNSTIVTSSVFNPQIAVDYYAIDPGHGFFVETDLLNAVSPEQPGQVSLGYYAARTPVCSSGCP